MSSHSPTPSPPDHRKQLRVAAVQMIFGRSVESNLRKIEVAASGAARRGVDAVLFPECATTGYAFDFSSLTPRVLQQALNTLSQLSASLRVHLLVGTPVLKERKLYNALVVFDRSGRPVHTYAKCQLTASDRRWFTPGNNISMFSLDGIRACSFICHERRYPELVRLPVMAGAQIVFHPNAGMDSLAVSRCKRNGRDGMAVRAFENGVFYVFANSVGPQGNGKWSAGDSKIVGPDGTVLKGADNQNEAVLVADLALEEATRKYARESLQHPKALARFWKAILPQLVRAARLNDREFESGIRRARRMDSGGSPSRSKSPDAGGNSR